MLFSGLCGGFEERSVSTFSPGPCGRGETCPDLIWSSVSIFEPVADERVWTCVEIRLLGRWICDRGPCSADTTCISCGYRLKLSLYDGPLGRISAHYEYDFFPSDL